ncbi:MAG TPA: hypothetical protein VGG74_01010 [Kofleriaceae bacterium]|jgi:hypothetical protein
MTYRDDRDADQARIAALEGELRDAKQRIAELDGTRSQALVVVESGKLVATASTSTAAKIFGGPRLLRQFRRYDRALSREHFEHLIERAREVTGAMGRSELLRTSVMWMRGNDNSAGPSQTVTVVVRDGTTTLQVTDRLGPLAGALYGGVGGGLGGGGLAIPIVLTTAMPVLAPVFFTAWFGGVFGLTRTLFKRGVRGRAIQLQALFDALAADIDAALPPPD